VAVPWVAERPETASAAAPGLSRVLAGPGGCAGHAGLPGPGVGVGIVRIEGQGKPRSPLEPEVITRQQVEDAHKSIQQAALTVRVVAGDE
jgi:hypothetical protein